VALTAAAIIPMAFALAAVGERQSDSDSVRRHPLTRVVNLIAARRRASSVTALCFSRSGVVAA